MAGAARASTKKRNNSESAWQQIEERKHKYPQNGSYTRQGGNVQYIQWFEVHKSKTLAITSNNFQKFPKPPVLAIFFLNYVCYPAGRALSGNIMAYFLAFYVAYLPTVCLASFLMYLLALYLTCPSCNVSGILSDILSGISAGVLPGISSGSLSDILSGMFAGVLSGISSGILSSISSVIFLHSTWHIRRRSIWHIFWRSFWHSIFAYFPAYLLLLLLSCIFSGASSVFFLFFRPPVEVRRCPLRSWSPRRCPLRSRGPGWSPALPWSAGAEKDKEEKKERSYKI